MGPGILSKEALAGWWQIMTVAPHLTVTMIAACLGAGYAAARWRYAGKTEHLEERIKLRDDEISDYKRKLGGATPDEAQARIEALEALVAPLKPHSLLEDQRTTLLVRLRQSPGKARIEFTVGDLPSREFSDVLAGIFSEAGWEVVRGQVITSWGKPNAGLRVMIPGDLAPTAKQECVLSALEAARLPFDRGDTMLPGDLDVRLLTGPRL